MNWFDIYNPNEGNYPSQSNSQYTVLSIPIQNPSRYLLPLSERFAAYNISLADGAEIDLQVQALIGSIGPETGVIGFGGMGTEFYGQTSAWSSTQTVNVPANVPISSSQSPLSTTSISLIVIAVLLAVIVIMLLLIRKRKLAYSTIESSPLTAIKVFCGGTICAS